MNRQYIKNKRKEARPAALMFIVISLLLPIPVFANIGPAVWVVTKLSSSEPSIGGVGSYSTLALDRLNRNLRKRVALTFIGQHELINQGWPHKRSFGFENHPVFGWSLA